MPSYTAPLTDIRFVLHEVLQIQNYANVPGFADADRDTVDAVLEEAAKLMQEVIAPLNLVGDTEGCKLENGVVKTPTGFKAAYDQFRDGGWSGLTSDPDFGGQGLPHVIGSAMADMMSGANLAFGMYPGLSHGAYEALHAYGTPEQKATYLPKLVSGEWTGTMNLTEPHCGTDLGLMRTKAEPQDDGSYKITGTKIFISAGDHDLAENIVHLVLAKIPGGPAGIKGVSLFVVPKFLVNPDGSLGARNSVSVGSLEHKMGIHGNATCVLNYDGATGWLIGEANKGMQAMFIMMNAARLGVAIQGIGIAEVAYQNAAAYAKERLQMRAITGTKFPDKPADPIIVHPDVRRMLLNARAFVEGARALAYWGGLMVDFAHKHPDAEQREFYNDLLALLTPVMKAYFTDYGYEAATQAQQVLGGHGYIHEWGMEQFVRDARITMIYEGANGVQALDLVARKLPTGQGRLIRRYFELVEKFITDNKADANIGTTFVEPLEKSFKRLQQGTMYFMQHGLSNPDNAGAASVDYLKIMALTTVAFMWSQMAKVAHEKLASGDGLAGKAYYETKIAVGRHFIERMLPDTSAHLSKMMSGSDTMMKLPIEAF